MNVVIFWDVVLFVVVICYRGLEELVASIFGLVQEKLCWTIMEMEAVSSSKSLIMRYLSTHCYIPEDCNLKVRYSNVYKVTPVPQ